MGRIYSPYIAIHRLHPLPYVLWRNTMLGTFESFNDTLKPQKLICITETDENMLIEKYKHAHFIYRNDKNNSVTL